MAALVPTAGELSLQALRFIEPLRIRDKCRFRVSLRSFSYYERRRMEDLAQTEDTERAGAQFPLSERDFQRLMRRIREDRAFAEKLRLAMKRHREMTARWVEREPR